MSGWDNFLINFIAPNGRAFANEPLAFRQRRCSGKSRRASPSSQRLARSAEAKRRILRGGISPNGLQLNAAKRSGVAI